MTYRAKDNTILIAPPARHVRPPEPPDPDPVPEVRPPLPPVDPNVVKALEKVLSESGDPAAPKLIIPKGEPAGAAQEPDGDPVSQWPYVPPDPRLPPTLVDPPDAGADEDEDADGPPAPEAGLPPPNLNEVLGQALDAIRAGNCTEIDCSAGGNVRAQSEFQFGAVSLRLMADSDSGVRWVLVSLVPEACGDLRAAQRAHNDRISRWITSLGQDETATTADEDPWEDDDEGDEELQARK